MLLVSSAGHDNLTPLLIQESVAFRLMGSAHEAILAASPGDSVTLLASNYPGPASTLDPALLETAREKRLRLYIEYAGQIPGLTLGDPEFLGTGPYGSILERVVVTSHWFAPQLDHLSLMGFYDCHYLPLLQKTDLAYTHLALGRVVGFHRAELGLPAEIKPLLLSHPHESWLIATTCLSRCIDARCSPASAWQAVWLKILEWLGISLPHLRWEPSVRPTYPAQATLPTNAQRDGLRRACSWIERSELLIHPDEAAELARQYNGTTPLVQDRQPGNGSHGIMESYTSKRVFSDGRHSVAAANRPDCTAQAAVVAALNSRLFGSDQSRQIACNLLDFTFNSPAMRPDKWSDPATALYGLLPFDTVSTELSFSDDNARAILGGILGGSLLGETRWDAPVLRCILANLRTTGSGGYRPNKCVIKSELLAEGWLPHWEFEGGEPSAHFHSWIWACYLWLYDKTGYAPLLERSRRGLETMMRTYPSGWTAEGGRLEEEIAHLLLPLAWLLRVDDRAEHRAWADTMFAEIEKLQAPCGAIAQLTVDQWSTEIDPAERRILHHPAQANADYGIEEGPLIYRNGDPGTDLLYSLNFAAAGLIELAAVTGDPRHTQALDKLMDFCLRAQTHSERHPELDGTWYRGFDYGLWDFWGSDTDWGYGVLTTEVGWTHSLITTTLALHEMGTNAWDLTRKSTIARDFNSLREAMLPKMEAQTQQQGTAG